jgi:hypothetical protein
VGPSESFGGQDRTAEEEISIGEVTPRADLPEGGDGHGEQDDDGPGGEQIAEFAAHHRHIGQLFLVVAERPLTCRAGRLGAEAPAQRGIFRKVKCNALVRRRLTSALRIPPL